MKRFASHVSVAVLSFVLAVPIVASAAAAFYIDTNGKVGIGNTSPQHALDISGSVYSRRYPLSDSSTIAVDWNNSNVQSVTLGGNRTFTFSNGQDGGQYTLLLNQDATGSRAVIWPSSVKWPGGIEPDLSTTSGSADVIEFVYDGTNYLGQASLEVKRVTADNFNSYSDGDLNSLNGGTNWSAAWSGDTTFDVQGTVTNGGARAVKLTQASSQEPTISRMFSAKTSGSLHWAQRKDGSDQIQGIALYSGGTRAMFVWMSSGNGALGQVWGINHGGSEVTTGFSYATGTFETVDLQFDAATDKYRVSINGSAYTSWKDFITGVSSVDKIEILTGWGGGSAVDGYWDDVRFNN